MSTGHVRYGDPDVVHPGQPITQVQAVVAILRMIHSRLLGEQFADEGPWRGLERARKVADLLSKGEQRLLDVAEALWAPTADVGARISVLGSLDKDNRRRVILVLTYYYLAGDAWPEATGAEFIDLFKSWPQRDDG